MQGGSPTADASFNTPDLIPARMVNEAAYCPRLFYLEWVQARFTDNVDTVDGRWQHRVVDREAGRLPEPGELDEVGVVRSVLLSSSRLGLIGKADLVEGDGDEVVPVDYKRGTPPANEHRSWEPERIQLCVLALLLREEGYRCQRGVLWFAGSRERVEVAIDQALVDRTLGLLGEMRSLAERDLAPPPLVDSPKCPRCSLVGICLPDEHNRLTARSGRKPRRLTPTDSSARPLYVTEPGATVGVRAGRVEVSLKSRRLASVRPIDVSQLCVFGNVQVTTQALRHCFDVEVPVCFFSGGGWLLGIAEGLPSKHVELRRRQVLVASTHGLEAARAFVRGKIRNARTLLRRNARSPVDGVLDTLARAVDKAADVDSTASLLGIEGAAARSYFAAFAAMLSPERALPGEAFSFEGRNRRPPRDAVNCLLSFAYALLVKDFTAVCLGVGLDPYLGLYHRPRFGRPALALDLAEELRPLIGDSLVIGLINNGEARPPHFVVRGPAVALTADGRKVVLAAYERRLDTELRHPTFGYQITYRRALEVQARLLGAWLLGELPEYVPLMTR